MRYQSVFLLAAILLAASSGGVDGSQQPSASGTPDVTTLGPQVGDAVPDFTLPDQSGQPRSLKSLVGKDGLVLVFYRSADW